MKSKPILLRFLALMLSSMIFLSSTGLSIDMHFCGDHLRSLSLFGDAKSCMEKINSCQKHAVKVEDKRCPIGCCSDKTVVVESQDNIFVQNLPITLDIQLTGCVFASYFNKIVEPSNEFIPSPLIYKPPKIIKRIYTLVESFLL